MNIKIDTSEVEALLDDGPIRDKYAAVTEVLSDQAAEQAIIDLVDTYSGNGSLIIPLDLEAIDEISAEETWWRTCNGGQS